MSDKKRCAWATKHEIFITYHDEEWGKPQHNDQKLFEMLNLEGAQAGLSWLTILQKRAHYQKVFDNFEPEVCAVYTDEYLETLRLDPGIVRNRLKINSVRTNAQAFLKVRDEFGSFEKYIWQFVGGKPIVNARKDMSEVPATTAESDVMSKDLKKRGFKFIGSTICYAYMQATGMVNDHSVDCFCY